KVGLIGVGRMGRYHLSVYERIAQQYGVELVAICDLNRDYMDGKTNIITNLEKSATKKDYSKYRKYTDYNELLEKEELDMVDIVLPTYLHCEVAVKALEKGFNVMCEKPMALNEEQCQMMTDAAKKSGKRLMIGHCLRFWSEYVFLKDAVESGRFGKVRGGYFYRGGEQDHKKNPSFEDWIITREKGGGGLFDQHIHDTDMINWVFGTPSAVTSTGMTVHPASAYDIVATNYIYDGKYVVTAMDDTVYNTIPFGAGYKVDFEGATLLYQNGKLLVYSGGNEPYVAPIPDRLPTKDGYANEIIYYINCIKNNLPTEFCQPDESKTAVKIALAERESADNNGKITEIK
ncbi:MAG: Gfo/Idh/MocA family oxidoreductase, partial [Clostridia bacterium]|nr:Gfo/Idh/MocA family oxidoreductase [Clostridia bacterium]